jgi:signal peptidase II
MTAEDMTSDGVAPPRRRARARWPLFIGLAGTVVVLDQLAKAWLVSILPQEGQRLSVVDDLVRLVNSHNSGALFGLFKDQAVLFGLVSLGVVALIVWYHGSTGRNTLLSVALGLLLGGALGNMTDRLRLGYVVDFVDAGVGDWRWYTFNVADAAISGAILLLVVSAFLPARFGLERPKAQPTGDPAEPVDA